MIRLYLRSLCAFAVILLCALGSAAKADCVVVFNEIMYHPTTNELALEWVELHNQMSVDVDISGWRIASGIDYTFPSNSVIKAGGDRVVAISPETLAATAGVTNALGPFTGRLSNSGETLQLRDRNNRLMDEVNYGTDGDWPAGSDGGGVSLAKKGPNLASKPAENWTVSAQIGGTPGAANFPSGNTPPKLAFNEVSAASASAFWLELINYGAVSMELAGVQVVRSGGSSPSYPMPAQTLPPGGILWLNQAQLGFSAADGQLGTAWRAPGYVDSAWSSGSGLFFFNTGSLPAPTNTPVAPGRTTYYFRASFNFSGATSNVTLNLRCVVDDGAVFYLNGAEIYRQNMPSGAIDYLTSATGTVGDADYAGSVTLTASNLVQGMNVLAVEVHQVTPSTTSSGIVLSGGGLTLVEEGPFVGTPPANLARQSGVTPFVTDSLAGYSYHNFTGLTDGGYGNYNSWIGNSGNPGYAGLRFGGLFTLSSIACGRDNLGVLSDRTLGLSTLQHTRVASPGTATIFTGNPDTGWATIGTLNYQGAGTGLFTSPSRRHRFAFSSVTATGIRLLVPATGLGSGTCIDELEVNSPDTSGDLAFGAELLLTTALVPAVPFTKSSEEWVEFYNRGTNAVDLTNWRIDGGINYRFPSGTVIQAGGYLVVASDAAAIQAE